MSSFSTPAILTVAVIYFATTVTVALAEDGDGTQNGFLSGSSNISDSPPKRLRMHRKLRMKDTLNDANVDSTSINAENSYMELSLQERLLKDKKIKKNNKKIKMNNNIKKKRKNEKKMEKWNRKKGRNGWTDRSSRGVVEPPGPQPTYAPNSVGATFVPGDLSQPCDGLMLSRGMDCRLLTTAGQPVQYDTGGQSAVPMHGKADGATVIAHPDGGWYYTSNSENGSGNGGVGSLRFNAQGQVIGYKRDLTGTSRNCGGGKTYWNTWVTCEEDGSNGFCWEVDPYTGHTAKTNVVNVGGNYESFAYDDQDPDVEARFFTTEDSGNGPLVRYTPTVAAFSTGNNYDILTSDGGTHEYLVLNADGTFEWSSSESAGASSASTYFPNAEGIDVINRQLFFVSKVNKELFELDLANMTWIAQSTVSGAFNQPPDQIQKIVGDDQFLYFCEDGGSKNDIHGRNRDGEFFTIVRGDGYNTETTGLAFSPDNMFMYVAFQKNSNVYAFWRTDGLSFGATKADIKYHQI